MEIKFDNGSIALVNNKVKYSDSCYMYSLKGNIEGSGGFEDTGLKDMTVWRARESINITGQFACGIKLHQVLYMNMGRMDEEITFINESGGNINIDYIGLGFTADMKSRTDWHLCAIPFRVQLDGNVHDYSVKTLIEGEHCNLVNGSKEFTGEKYYGNSVYSDITRPEPPLTEEGVLRSEAWAWGNEDSGIVIIKYNNNEIEYSIACPHKNINENYPDAAGPSLRFGGAGLCLYGEPSGIRNLKQGQSYTFGKTSYIPYNGGINEAYYIYRKFIEEKGHGFPETYNPPVNWNELYDIGWYHSDQKELKKYYTREALLNEAKKAKQCGCELLYLDPGWEVAEGTTIWDSTRLGKVSDLVNILKKEYNLDLGYRTILLCYTNYWPHKYLIRRSMEFEATADFFANQFTWPLCICDEEFRKEKLRRIADISRHGVKFMMFDEMQWRGVCIDKNHKHETPTKLIDHVKSVYRLAAEVRKQCPGLLAEVHDPIWPWHSCIYVPTYFGQGFGEKGDYDENWGFEYMWNCMNDLKSGKALALYYYNLGCSIPLYLHITMAADNDNCLFFWWAASTIRHLGIGGKDSNPSVEYDKLPPYDHEKRFDSYCKQMGIYKKLKAYFVKGNFYGINEYVHLHTLNGMDGGVINVFNAEDEEKVIAFSVPFELIGTEKELDISYGEAFWGQNSLEIKVKVGAMSPALLCLGDAAAICRR